MLFASFIVAVATVFAQDLVMPQVFGPGVLSEGDVYRGTFSPDARTFYFFKRTTRDPEEYRIFTSALVSGRWQSPVVLDLGGDFSNTYPAISADGGTLVFASSRPAPGGANKNYYLWAARREGNGWGTPTYLDTLNMPGQYHSWPAFGPDGRLYFRRVSDRPASLVARVDNGRFSAAEPDPIVEQCSASVANLRVAGGQPGPRSGLYFLDVAIPRSGDTPGHADIWVCEQNGRQWTARPLGPEVNTPAFETFPFFSRDGQDLFFVRGFTTFYRMPFEAARHRQR